MDANFWQERWANKNTNWHQSKPNPLLVEHFDALALRSDAQVFVPLCGKTLDIAWLRQQGCRVSGVELSEMAVIELFDDMQITPTVTQSEKHEQDLLCYSAPGLCIYVGDFFLLALEDLDAVDAIYDRAALVALPPAMRQTYASHLQCITNCAPQLLITFNYDQSKMPGPPHSIPPQEIQQHYSKAYHIQQLEARPVDGGLKGQVEAI